MVVVKNIKQGNVIEMAKGYEDLSRRGLIALGKDFDLDNDAELLKYLTEHSERYEDIRPVEALICKVDNLGEAIKGSSITLKKSACTEGNKVLDSVVDVVDESSRLIASGIRIAKAIVNKPF